jgi:hypothetical protein
VLNRYERIEQLRKTGHWKSDEEQSPFGLPKVRVIRIKKRGKEKKKKEEATEGGTKATGESSTAT